MPVHCTSHQWPCTGPVRSPRPLQDHLYTAWPGLNFQPGVLSISLTVHTFTLKRWCSWQPLTLGTSVILWLVGVVELVWKLPADWACLAGVATGTDQLAWHSRPRSAVPTTLSPANHGISCFRDDSKQLIGYALFFMCISTMYRVYFGLSMLDHDSFPILKGWWNCQLMSKKNGPNVPNNPRATLSSVTQTPSWIFTKSIQTLSRIEPFTLEATFFTLYTRDTLCDPLQTLTTLTWLLPHSACKSDCFHCSQLCDCEWTVVMCSRAEPGRQCWVRPSQPTSPPAPGPARASPLTSSPTPGRAWPSPPTSPPSPHTAPASSITSAKASLNC